jgi:hypothetical protein
VSNESLQGRRRFSAHGALAIGFITFAGAIIVYLASRPAPTGFTPLNAASTCRQALLQLDEAITVWAGANDKDTLSSPTVEMLRPYFVGRLVPVCPLGGSMTPGTRSMATKCSIHGIAQDDRPAPPPEKPSLAERLRRLRYGVAALNSCVANLRQIDGAKQQWALENNKRAEDVPAASDVAPYLKGSQMPCCPSGLGKYILNTVGGDPQCTRAVFGHTL